MLSAHEVLGSAPSVSSLHKQINKQTDKPSYPHQKDPLKKKKEKENDTLVRRTRFRPQGALEGLLDSRPLTVTSRPALTQGPANAA